MSIKTINMKIKTQLLISIFSILLCSCIKDTDSPIEIEKIISVSINGNDHMDSVVNVRADGVTKLKVTAKLGENSDDGKTIIFSTSNGEIISFDGATGSNNISQVAVNKEASVFLKTSLTPENGVFINAKVSDYSMKRYLNFLPANPDTFFIRPEQYFTTADKINIDVDLLRNAGFVSNTIPVYFDATVVDTTTGLKTTIEAFKFTENPNRTSPLTMRATLQKINSNTGAVKVKVKFKTDKGTFIEKSVTLNFN